MKTARLAGLAAAVAPASDREKPAPPAEIGAGLALEEWRGIAGSHDGAPKGVKSMQRPVALSHPRVGSAAHRFIRRSRQPAGVKRHC